MFNIFVIVGDDVYATAFVPTSGAIVAHHIKLYNCNPGKEI
jgi:hypothetical protein